ncbi:hypothetical protein LTR28_012121, partial [Elasticomyces elasticus]
MPATEYKTTGGGLKLKGVKSAGVDKTHRKKRKRTQGGTATSATYTRAGSTIQQTAGDDGDLQVVTAEEQNESTLQNVLPDEDVQELREEEGDGSTILGKKAKETPALDERVRAGDGKTMAQRRHEETRRKR